MVSVSLVGFQPTTFARLIKLHCDGTYTRFLLMGLIDRCLGMEVFVFATEVSFASWNPPQLELEWAKLNGGEVVASGAAGTVTRVRPILDPRSFIVNFCDIIIMN